MKIVQSFWTKPGLKKDNIHVSDRNMGGWVDKKYNYMSWTLSCLQFRRYYEKVELVTDAYGYDLLIDKLALPYTNVTVCLDEINHYHHDLWALGKIVTYGLQDEPFIHADGDIFIYQKFPDRLETAALVAQNIERGFQYYNDVFDAIGERFKYIPETLSRSKTRNQEIIGVNAGLMGGTHVAFFKEYSRLAVRFVDENIHHLDKINIGLFNTVFEQFLYHALAEDTGIPIDYYTSNINHAFDGLAEFTSLPVKTRFVHTVGLYKRLKYAGEMLAFRLLTDHPEYYYRVLNLLRTNQL